MSTRKQQEKESGDQINLDLGEVCNQEGEIISRSDVTDNTHMNLIDEEIERTSTVMAVAAGDSCDKGVDPKST